MNTLNKAKEWTNTPDAVTNILQILSHFIISKFNEFSSVTNKATNNPNVMWSYIAATEKAGFECRSVWLQRFSH